MRFRDRSDAGRQLARAVASLRSERPVVVGLPRGGVPVAVEVARYLRAPLDVLVVRKLGLPDQPELGVGAVCEDGVSVFNWELAAKAGVDLDVLHRLAARERAELDRRVVRYRRSRPRIPVEGRTVIVVDDGLATGFTIRAAVEALRHSGARRVVVAVPVAATAAADDMRAVADTFVCLAATEPFGAVGHWYDDFHEVTDEEVAELLAATSPPADGLHRDVADGRPVEVIAGARLPGLLSLPDERAGLVLFAHGSGSSRLSPRNQYVARELARAGVGTLLFDLLTDDEAEDRQLVFDVPLLAGRLAAATRWATDQLAPPPLIGYFGASTGAAAALSAAAHLGPAVSAVVSRGGRPDLAGNRLGLVTAATLLIVGGRDEQVLGLNRQAAAHLARCEHRLVVVPGATHLFTEPDTLETVAELATSWFLSHFGRADAGPDRLPA